jgi:hypothetical protein
VKGEIPAFNHFGKEEFTAVLLVGEVIHDADEDVGLSGLIEDLE